MVKSVNLHYEEGGAGPVLINLHGWPAEHGQMMALMEPLFQQPFNWRRIYPDLPGMGRSPRAQVAGQPRPDAPRRVRVRRRHRP